MKILSIVLFFLTSLAPDAMAAGGGMDPQQLSLVWALPFVGILLSLALLPIFKSRFWHHNYGKIGIFWALTTIIPMAWIFGPSVALHQVLHTYLLEYIPFILVASVLYTISGGIKVQLKYNGTPALNTAFLAVATFIASWIGTTGAAMLFIRPLLMINGWREHRTHIVILFILLVCNLGGSLTALGDPPLFLGFLQGVDFFWPLTNLMKPFLIVTLPVLGVFFVIDTIYYRKEDHSKIPQKEEGTTAISGKINLVLMGIVMISVITSGYWKPGISFSVYGIDLQLQNVLRDLIFIALIILSMRWTKREIREYNYFSWEPVLEVAKLFAVIFITAMPVITMLGAGEEGALSAIVSLVTKDGQPLNEMYFWMTGMLSAFLDNAPTYLVFFHMAGGDAQQLMGPMAETLMAISAGAVFMGALSYIGNAPNFMVKAIAEINRIPMPSFFGYMAWSCGILLPLFAIMAWLVF
ncbi:MAG: sodium:proton antiporter [Alphaproteobacteria bacterium]